MIFSGAKLCIKERGCGFVQNDDRCVLHNRPGDGNALALAAGKRAACLADDGVKALRQRHDKVVAPRLLCSGLHLLHGGVGLAEADIVGDGVREQIGPLEHEGEIADEAVVAVLPHIPSAKAHTAGLHIPEPCHKIAEGCLAASGGPYCDCGYKKKGFVKAGTEAGR